MGACLVAVWAPGCGLKSGVCSAIGCNDQATIGIQQPNGAAIYHALTIDIDGRVVACAAPLPTGGPSCDTGVTVTAREHQECFEEAAGSSKVLRCTATGKFEQVVVVTGTPKSIRITVNDGAAVPTERVFAPQYMDVQPNGPDCGPTCRQWGQTWILP